MTFPAGSEPLRLFVTGAGRSGTTLLDKLLSLHRDAIVLSQPLPLLYVAIKKQFLTASQRLRDVSGHYPLSDMTGENNYPLSELEEFLETFRLDHDFCRDVLLRQIHYAGQYTKPENPLSVLDGFHSDSLLGFLGRYVDCYSPKPAARVRGSKETLCEEFIPYLTRRHVRVILLIRDPRDVLASLDHGAGLRFGGRRKPPLFNIRQWRKSVACALAYASHDSLLVIRYEDLVTESSSTLSRVTSFLGIDPIPQQLLTGGLRSQSGELWRANSSHAAFTTLSDQSVGRYRSLLDAEEDRFVQALCYAELRRMGYALEIEPDDIPRILTEHAESAPLEREELAAYQWNAARRDEELARRRALVERRFDEIWFPFPESFPALAG